MALPTSALTLHWKTSDGSFVYENVNGGGLGVHTGNNPAAETAIEVVENQPDGSLTDVALITVVEDSSDPVFKAAGSSAMKQTSLFFDGSNDRFLIRNQDNSASKQSDDVVNASAFTLGVAFRPTTITATSGTPYQNQNLISANDYFGIGVRDASGTKQVEAWIYDGAPDFKVVRLTIAVDRTWLAFAYYDGSTLTLRLIDDVGTVTSDSVSSGNILDVTGEPVLIGAGGTAAFHGYYGEGVFYDANKTGSERTDLENYFKSEWLTLGRTFVLARV